MISYIWSLRKSLTAQLGVLSIVFAGLAIAQFLLAPAIEYSKLSEDSSYARSMLMGEIYKTVKDKSRPLENLKKSQIIKKVQQANPDFRLYVDRAGETVSIGGAFYSAKFADVRTQLESAPALMGESLSGQGLVCKESARVGLPFVEQGKFGYVHMSNCPDYKYYMEIYGVDAATYSRSEYYRSYFSKFKFEWIKEYVIVAIGLLAIAFYIFYRAISSIKRLESETRKFRLGHQDLEISKDKLPFETLPLVDALNEMIRRINDAREKDNLFLASAAHELRTPLTILRTRLEKLPLNDLSAALKQDVRRMSRQIEQLLRLTRLKTFNLGNAGLVDLLEVCRKTVALLAPVALDKAVKLELLCDDDTVRVNGERDLIATSITNVIHNAISFSKQDDVITVSLGKSGTITVTDQGPGIQADKPGRIFEPYLKFPPNRQGHGLGLAIVREILAIHGGAITARNLPAGGAEFQLEFPVAKAKGHPPPSDKTMEEDGVEKTMNHGLLTAAAE